MVTSQADIMTAYVGDPKYWKLCPSFFTCGTPMASNAGSAALSGNRDFDAAKKLVAEAGYKGEKIILIDAVDQPLIHAEALVTTEALKKLGLNVEYVASDWGTVVTRRASKKPAAEGGWNIFETGWVGSDTLDPSVNVMLRANGDKAWFGWPSDDKLEELRTQWLKASDSEVRQEIAGKIQQRAFEVVPYVPTGQFFVKTALRKNIKGYISAPAIFHVEYRKDLNAHARPNNAASQWPIATAVRQSATESITLAPACISRPSLASSNVCRLKAEKARNHFAP